MKKKALPNFQVSILNLFVTFVSYLKEYGRAETDIDVYKRQVLNFSLICEKNGGNRPSWLMLRKTRLCPNSVTMMTEQYPNRMESCLLYTSYGRSGCGGGGDPGLRETGTGM